MGSFQDFASCNKVSSNSEMNSIPKECSTQVLCCVCSLLPTISLNEREKVTYCTRGANFSEELAGFGWMIEILNDFLQGFQKCKNF